MKERILPLVLRNAYQFGSVNTKAVMGLVLKNNPELKKDVPTLLLEIEKIAKEVSNLSKKELEEKLKAYPQIEKEKSKGPLKELLNAKMEKVVVRIAPSPTGPLHIGHAYGASLNYEYAKMYNGKFLLRIEDTNPEKIFPPAYQMIEEDANWLSDNHVTKVIVQSSRLEIYYDHAEKLVQKEKAYVCTCDPDEWRTKKNKSIACACRVISKKENLIRYAKMFGEYAEGEAVLRLKTNINDKNPAMRDF